jgi:3-hydroxyacyl-[acyl-carrier-protein] dehydratase
MDTEKLLKKYRKKPLATLADFPRKVKYGLAEIKKLIPHREPFLFVDNILGIDLAQGQIIGTRFISGDDPIFEGHFPGFPVYPASLQLEMIGQMGLCLYYFIHNNTTVIEGDVKPPGIRVSRVLGAHFMDAILPEKTVTLVARKLTLDPFFGTVLMQTQVDGKICSVSITEVLFLD